MILIVECEHGHQTGHAINLAASGPHDRRPTMCLDAKIITDPGTIVAALVEELGAEAVITLVWESVLNDL